MIGNSEALVRQALARRYATEEWLREELEKLPAGLLAVNDGKSGLAPSELFDLAETIDVLLKLADNYLHLITNGSVSLQGTRIDRFAKDAFLELMTLWRGGQSYALQPNIYGKSLQRESVHQAHRILRQQCVFFAEMLQSSYGMSKKNAAALVCDATKGLITSHKLRYDMEKYRDDPEYKAFRALLSRDVHRGLEDDAEQGTAMQVLGAMWYRLWKAAARVRRVEALRAEFVEPKT